MEALPLHAKSVDVVFSYSVLQHVDRAKVAHFFQEVSRVLKPGGLCLVQLPNAFGMYSIIRQAKRSFRDAAPNTFEMRYWTREGIRDVATNAGLRGLRLSVDGFFTQDPQLSDLDLLSPLGKMIVLASHVGRKAADKMPLLARLADSLWVEARSPRELTSRKTEREIYPERPE
jgi:SAM-dependent methyltransferase